MSVPLEVDQTLDFQTHFRLLGEAHDQEIKQMQQNHVSLLHKVLGENATLREDLARLRASLTEDLPNLSSHCVAGMETVSDTVNGRNDSAAISAVDAKEVHVCPISLADCLPLEPEDELSESMHEPIPLERCANLETGASRDSYVNNVTQIASIGAAPQRGSCSNLLRLSGASSLVDSWCDLELLSESNSAPTIEEMWQKLCESVLAAEETNLARLHQVWHPTKTQIEMLSESPSGFASSSSLKRISSFLYQPIASRSLETWSPAIGTRVSQVKSWKRPSVAKGLFLMSPGCKFRVFWDFLCILWCTHDFFIFPVYLLKSFDSQRYTLIMTWMMAVFWTIDIFLSMSTGFYTPEGAVEMRRRQIIIAYTTRWLPLDLPVVLVDWILLCVPNSGVSKMKIVTRFVRMVRLLRVVKLVPKAWDYVGQINSEHAYALAQLLSYIFLIILINHYIACGLYGTWQDVEAGGSFAEGYLRALHWALAHSTLGSMDIYPNSAFERLWTCVILVISMILFSTFLSSITNSIAQLRSLRYERIRQERVVRSFFSENNISRELAAQVWNFIWRSGPATKCHHTKESEVQLFTLLPIQLRVEIKVAVFLPVLLNHPIFNELYKTDSEAIVKLCHRGIEQLMLRSSERLCWENAMEENRVNRMFFVTAGSVVYLPFYDSAGSITVHKNEWACEEVLWSSNPQLTGPFVGGTKGADLMLIVPEPFQLISASSQSSGLLSKYAQIFILRFNAASVDENCTDLLFNDTDTIIEILDDAEEDLMNRKLSKNAMMKSVVLGNNIRCSATSISE